MYCLYLMAIACTSCDGVSFCYELNTVVSRQCECSTDSDVKVMYRNSKQYT